MRIDLSRSVNTLSSYREGASSCSRCYVDKVGLIFLWSSHIRFWGEGSLSKEGGAAFLFHYFISPIRFNLLLDDLDVELEMRFKNLTYARFQQEIFVPIFKEQKDPFEVEAFNEILKECSIVAELQVRGGWPSLSQEGCFSSTTKVKLQLNRNRFRREFWFSYS